MMYFTKRFYIVMLLLVLLFVGGYMWTSLFLMGQVGLLVLLFVVPADVWMVYSRKGVAAERTCAERFSNDDENPVQIRVENHYPFTIKLRVIDEIPAIFQQRDINFRLSLAPTQGKTIRYTLQPKQRGTYGFGLIRVFVATRIGLVERRITCGNEHQVKVYPSYLMLHRYELMAMSNNLTEMGIKKIRRIGQQTEFEHIKEYVKGDDYRTINWKASARRHTLMVNVYQDERSQQVYSIIDKGRVMQRAFRGMTLLDYAINASLVLSYIAIHKDDKAGLATFNEQFDSFIPASRQSGQVQALLEGLYQQQTSFGETDYSALCVHLGKYINKRSFLILYTDFDTLGALNRQLAYLRQLAQKHRLLVVFFEDAELKEKIARKPEETEQYYQQVVAEKFAYEKRLIVSKLKQCGIYSLLTTPENLSVDVINKYLEMKSRQLLT